MGKTLSQLIHQWALALFALAASAHAAMAQPEYALSSPTLVSGTDKQVGAVYSYSTIKAGVDAQITITALVNASIDSIDRVAVGFDEAFQPMVRTNASSTGYAEFTITFLAAGTSSPLTQAAVRVTSVDVDGTSPNIYERDQYNLSGGIVDYNAAGTALSVYQSGAWIVGENIDGNNYSGIDTANKDVMFTAIASNISSFSVRMGSTNNGGSSNARNKSLYFRKFNYENSALPITLTSFSAARHDSHVELLWSTAFERDNSHFIVERSADGHTSESILTIAGAGNSSDLLHYSAHDNEPLPGTTYYRLKQVDLNGSYSYSEWVRVNGSKAGSAISIYPNPVRDGLLTVSIDGSIDPKFGDLHVTDLLGRRRMATFRMKSMHSDQLEVDVSALEPGIYFLCGQDSHGPYAFRFSRH